MPLRLLDSMVSHLAARGLRASDRLVRIYDGDLPVLLGDLLYRPDDGTDRRGQSPRLGEVERRIDASDWPLLPNLVPLMAIDEQSFACVVCSDAGDSEPLPGEGAVVRWHTGVKTEPHQAALLDTDCLGYVLSVAEELVALPGRQRSNRQVGLDRVLDEIGPAYSATYIEHEKRPRDFVVRPVRIACQNVIVALAAIAQDSSFDGLAVVAWQTCEVPHVATHEANRALAALTLCDAFQSGGTMEIRFDRPARLQLADGSTKSYPGHPEMRVPASLRRYGRTVGVELGAVDEGAISPAEARELFVAVTPMPDELRSRVQWTVDNDGIAPERLCYALMTGTWKPIELDMLLASSSRVASIVAGGADWTDRPARQAESEVCRAAVMIGMLFDRLNNRDSAGVAGNVRLLEDDRQGVSWHCEQRLGAVEFDGLDSTVPLPWLRGMAIVAERLVVVPRTILTDESVDSLPRSSPGCAVAVLLPLDVDAADLPAEVVVLRCPERLADLDKQIEAKLLTARISRG